MKIPLNSLWSVLMMVVFAGVSGSQTAAAGEVKKVLLPSPNSSLVAFRVLIKTGAAYDEQGKEGLATLTAATMAEGGTPELTYSEVIEALYPTAARITVSVDKEFTIFSGTVHREKLSEFYGIFRDIIISPRFDTEDFIREKDDHINYLTKILRGNDDESLGKEVLGLSLYENHPYGHTNTGTVQGLQNITLDDLKRFHHNYYTGDRITVGVAGGYPEEILRRIDRDFGSLPEGTLPDVKIASPEAFEGIQVVIVEKPCRATAISIGFPIDVTRADDDYFPLLVANSYLGEHRTFNGLLMQKIRGRRGLNYGDYSYIEHFVQDGGTTFVLPNLVRSTQYFSIWIRPVGHEHAHFALRTALRELDRLTSGDVDHEALMDTKSFLVHYSKLWTQSLTRRLGFKMDSELYGMEDFITKIEKELPGLDEKTILDAVKKHLDNSGVKIVIVTEDAEALRENLLSNKPSPMIYESGTTPPNVIEEDHQIEKYELDIHPENVRIINAGDLFEK